MFSFSVKSLYFSVLLLIFSGHFLGLNNLLMAYEDKTAYAMCVFSLALGPNTEPMTFVGKTLVNIFFCNHKYVLPTLCSTFSLLLLLIRVMVQTRTILVCMNIFT